MLHRILILLMAALVFSACQPPATPEAAAPRRPSFELATDVAYDFSVIEPYAGDHQAVYDYIDDYDEVDGNPAARELLPPLLEEPGDKPRVECWPDRCQGQALSLSLLPEDCSNSCTRHCVAAPSGSSSIASLASALTLRPLPAS